MTFYLILTIAALWIIGIFAQSSNIQHNAAGYVFAILWPFSYLLRWGTEILAKAIEKAKS